MPIDSRKPCNVKLPERGKKEDVMNVTAFSDVIQWARIFLIAYLLDYVWETWQLSFFENNFVYSVPWSIHILPFIPAIVWDISISALLDAFLVTSGFIFISFSKGKKWRCWLARASKSDVVFLTIYCIVISVISEMIGRSQGWWVYDNSMPVILGVGVIPILAFAVIPPVTVMLMNKIAIIRD
jgi:uncharacterized membrane protein YozB (DUF420 family)